MQFSYGEASGTADGIVPGGYDYEEGKEAFLKYLNFQAWYNPEKQRQEAYEGSRSICLLVKEKPAAFACSSSKTRQQAPFYKI